MEGTPFSLGLMGGTAGVIRMGGSGDGVVEEI